MSSQAPICLESQFKQRLSHVKSAIQSTLGVGASTTHAYDILAVSQGFANYQTAKGRAQMPYYEWGLNIGTAQAPYFMMKAIGHHRNTEEARGAGALLLSGSPDHATWVLFENGRPIPVSFSAHKDAISWDLRDVHASLLQAVSHHVSALRLRQMDGKAIVDYQTRKGWLNGVVLSDVCSNDALGVMTQLQAIAAQIDNGRPDLLSFGMPIDDVVVHVRAHIMRVQDGNIIHIRLYDPRAHQYRGSLLEGCPAFRQLRTDVNAAKSGLFLIVGQTGSGRLTTSTYLMSQLNIGKQSGALSTGEPLDALSMSDVHKKLMRSDADIVCAGEIRDRNALFAAIDAAKTKLVIARLHASGSGALSRLQAMGADLDSIHGVLKGVYSQCLMRSAEQNVVIPVSSYRLVEGGKLVGLSLLEEARLLYLRGGVSDSEMHNQFGDNFERGGAQDTFLCVPS